MANTHHAEGHHGPTIKTYMVIFGALCVLTAVSFVANTAARNGSITGTQSFMLILGVAIVKAVMVGMYFMHLVTDWGKLYYFIIPALVLGALAIIVLLPDMVLTWRHLWKGT